MRTGVDVGGTFTDVVAWDGRRLATGKVPTTPDQSEGVASGVAEVSGSAGVLLHGTTAATNALLERRGARTVLVADEGFEDLIEIGRQDRPSLYDGSRTRPQPLAPRDMRLGLAGRSLPGGSQSGPSPALDEVARRVAELRPEAIAVSLLYSFEDPERERALGRELSRLLGGDVALSLSSEVVAEFREFERTSTTLVNAYLLPVVSRYLASLTDRSESLGVEGALRVMRSSGGLIDAAEAARLPAAILLSGPAGGVVAATALGKALGHDHLVSFDMGGTSTDVCRIDFGRPDVAYERSIDGLPCRMPSVAIHTVGAGGGSIGWVDAGGALRVGPHSAGAVPGPASYGRGGLEPAVTDANLVLGRIPIDTRLGGSMELDARTASAALAKVGDRVGMSAQETAAGIVEVVESHMERAVRRVSIEEGADPRRAVLVAFGGAGGLHATALARRLDMNGVVVPAHAGVFSALGLLLAPPRADAARSVRVEEDDAPALDRSVAEIAASAERDLGAGVAVRVSTFADVRYLGQSHETTVRYRPGDGWDALAERFHDAHRERNGFARPGDPIEVVTVRAEAVGNPAIRWDDLPEAVPSGEADRPGRPVLDGGRRIEAAGWWRPGLPPGAEIVGPAVIEEPEATTFLGAGERAIVHPSGALEISW
jgi:N-methylhydantoinase A